MDRPDQRDKICCPECGSYAVYRYGRSHTARQRYICLMCRRQFSPGFERASPKERPLCPKCGKPMHVYKKDRERTVFRCSRYPGCRSYVAVGKDGHAHSPTS